MKRGCLTTIAIVSLGIISFFAYGWFYTTHSDYGIHKEDPGLKWLPPESRNVTYYENWVTKSAQFTIDEESIIRWAESMERPLAKIKEKEKEGYRVMTSRQMLESEGALDPLPDPKTIEETEAWMQSHRKDFEVGDLYYSVEHSNGGGYWIGYDVSEGRGYYFYAHH